VTPPLVAAVLSHFASSAAIRTDAGVKVISGIESRPGRRPERSSAATRASAAVAGDRPRRGGKGDAYQYRKRCHPGAIAPTRTRERVRKSMRAWRQRYGRPPSSTDWSRTHAQRRGGEPLKRLQSGEWPSPSTVIDLYGTWAAAVLSRTPLPTSDRQRLAGPPADVPGTYQTRGPAGFRSATMHPTATRRRSTPGTSWRSPTPPSCSNGCAATASTFRAGAS
jgi:hypothetical protein